MEFFSPPAGSLTPNLLNFKLVRVLEKVRAATKLDENTFCRLLEIEEEMYPRILKGEHPVEVIHLVRLSQEFGLNTDLIFSGKIDYRTLSAAYCGAAPVLPERYLHPRQKLARVRTIHGILDYLNGHSPPGYPEKILSRLQVGTASFGDPDTYTSPLLIEDLLNELESEGFGETAIREMGRSTFWVNRNTEIGRTLSQANSPRELYVHLHERLLGSFDRIWNYRMISLKSNHCLIEVSPKGETQDLFRNRKIGSRAICLCRQGVFTSMAGFLGYGFADLVEKECMYQGSHRCIYEISWGQLDARIRQPSTSRLYFL